MPTTSAFSLKRRPGAAATRAAAGAHLLVIAFAATAGLLLAQGSRLALVLVAAPLLLLLAASMPAAVAVLGMALLPFPYDLTAGGALKVSASDLLFAVSIAGLLAARAVGRGITLRVLSPVAPWIWVYVAALACITLIHPSLAGVVDAFQRVQIVVVPLALGALLVVTDRLDVGVRLYALGCVILAVAFAVDVGTAGALGVQKNPAGQFMAGAILLLVGVRSSRWIMMLALPPLAVGIFATQSRGSLLGLAVGLAMLLVLQPGLSRLRVAAGLIPLVCLFAIGFLVLPEEARNRATDVRADRSAGQVSEGASTVEVRESYREDAQRIYQEHPVAGVGIGQYADAASDKVADPHNVVLLEAAEGGTVLVAGFIVLMVGSTAVVAAKRRTGPLAVTAVAVQGSTLAHALVDVYWVRGTPVLGWLLVGAALAAAARSTERA